MPQYQSIDELYQDLQAADQLADRELAALIARRIQAVEGARVDAARDAVARGVEYGVGSLARGVRQLVPGQTAAQKAALAEEQSAADLRVAPARAFSPGLTSLGEGAPYIATGPLSPGYAALATGAGEALKYGTVGDRVQRGLVGGASSAVGSLVGGGLARALNPVTPYAASQSRQAALKAAQRLGVRPRLSQVTGGKFAEALEGMAAHTPGGAGVMAEVERANAAAVNRAGARSIGAIADELTPSTLRAARSRIVAPFRAVEAMPGRPILIDKRVGDAGTEILKKLSHVPIGSRDPGVSRYAQDAVRLSQQGARITGEAYNTIRSDLTNSAYQSFSSSNAKVGRAYQQLLSALDGSAERSLVAAGHETLAADIRAARPLYANLKLLEKGGVIEGGNLVPAPLKNALIRQNPAAYKEGVLQGQPLYDVALLAEELKKVAGLPQIGLARATASSPLASLLAALPSYGAAKLVTNPAVQAYPSLVGRSPLVQRLLAPTRALPATGRAFAFPAIQYALPLLAPNVAE